MKKTKKKVVCSETENKSFRFADAVGSKSIKTVKIPIVNDSKRMLLEVDVIKNNILLLICKGTMSKLGMKIDFTKHEAEVNAQVIKLQCNSSGHYCITLTTLVKDNWREKEESSKTAPSVMSCIKRPLT